MTFRSPHPLYDELSVDAAASEKSMLLLVTLHSDY